MLADLLSQFMQIKQPLVSVVLMKSFNSIANIDQSYALRASLDVLAEAYLLSSPELMLPNQRTRRTRPP